MDGAEVMIVDQKFWLRWLERLLRHIGGKS
jgi:hypothetical protein